MAVIGATHSTSGERFGRNALGDGLFDFDEIEDDVLKRGITAWKESGIRTQPIASAVAPDRLAQSTNPKKYVEIQEEAIAPIQEKSPPLKEEVEEKHMEEEKGSGFDLDLARQLREAAEASPFLAHVRKWLAEEKVLTAVPEYVSFSRHISERGDIRGLPIAEVSDVARASRTPRVLKAPVVVEQGDSWPAQAWDSEFWRSRHGTEEQTATNRHPLFPSDTPKTVKSVPATIDMFCEYMNVVQRTDSQCVAENALALPRFFIGCWVPFLSSDRSGKLFDDSWRALAPRGVQDLTHRWVQMLANAFRSDWLSIMKAFYQIQMGPPGVVGRLRVERCDCHSWFGQIEGRRLFILFPPEEGSNLYERMRDVEHGSDERATYSLVDIFYPNAKKHPKFHNAKAQMVVLDPCEALVVPKGWWIYDVTLESCVTLFHRFWNRTNQASMCEEFRCRFNESTFGPEMASRALEIFERLGEMISMDTSDEDDG